MYTRNTIENKFLIRKKIHYYTYGRLKQLYKNNSNMRYLIILFTIHLGLSGLLSQELNFSLKEAQDYALQNNKTLINANKDVAIAEQQVKENIGNGLPQVNGTVDYMTYFNYEFAFGMGSSGTIDNSHPSFDDGDQIIVGILNQAFGSGESTIVMEDQANANVQVTQLLFNGQYWIGVQMAKTGKKIAEQNVSSTELDIKENVTNSYYLILVSEELLKILEENKKNLEEILMHTSNMYKTGIAEQTDVDQLRISLSQLENSKKSMERNLQLSYNMFRITMGIETEDEIKLNDSIPLLVKGALANISWDSSFNINNNPTYQLMLTQEEMGEKSVTMQKWAYGPTLSGFYSYTEKLLTSDFDLSPKSTAGLTLSVPIFAGGIKKAQLSQAKIELDKITRNRKLIEQQLAMQNNQLTFELKNAYENYQTQKENVNVAQRVFDNINNKYKQGMSSSLDLTQANNNYLQAQNNYVSSILSLLQAKMQLDKLNNSL